jgi:hypothetical protein
VTCKDPQNTKLNSKTLSFGMLQCILKISRMDAEHGVSSKHLWNVGQFLWHYTVTHSRRQPPSYLLPLQPQFTQPVPYLLACNPQQFNRILFSNFGDEARKIFGHVRPPRRAFLSLSASKHGKNITVTALKYEWLHTDPIFPRCRIEEENLNKNGLSYFPHDNEF